MMTQPNQTTDPPDPIDTSPVVSLVKTTAATCLVILVASVLSVTGSLFIGKHVLFNTTALPIPALGAVLGLLVSAGLVRAIAGRGIFSRKELLCILYSALIAAPLATIAFWQVYVPFITVLPRAGDFETMDAVPSGLWPHGPEMLAGQLHPDTAGLITFGDAQWLDDDSTDPDQATLRLTNRPGERSGVRFPLPVRPHIPDGLEHGTAYRFSVLARAESLDPKSTYYVRLFIDDGEAFAQELVGTRDEARPTLLHPDGFRRVGRYNFRLPGTPGARIELEIGLEGEGRLDLRDPSLFSVQAIEDLYLGRVHTETGIESHSGASFPSHVIRKPDGWMGTDAWTGKLFGHIPWRDWTAPLINWGGFIVLLMATLFGLHAIMRRKWMERERLPLPFGRPAAWLIGCAPETGRPLENPIWQRTSFRIAFAAAFAWCLLVGWSRETATMPELAVRIPLAPFFSGPELGQMFKGVSFTLSLLLIGLGLFLEINLLISIVVGYFAFRSLYWFGESFGLDTQRPYPYPGSQFAGAYIGYTVVIVALSFRYIAGVVRNGLLGRNPDNERISPRLAVLTAVVGLAGLAAWPVFSGVGTSAAYVAAGLLLSFGFIAGKLRAEAGLPHGSIGLYWIPQNLAALLVAFGFYTFMDASGMVFFVLVFAMLGLHVFLAVPGLQMEMIELGSRFGVPGGRTLWTGLLGTAGGLVIGGWVFLNLVYARGLDQLAPIKDVLWAWQREFRVFEQAAGRALAETGLTWTTEHAFAIGAGAATMLTALARTLFAGFWFHPAGLLLGPTQAAQFAWGSLLVAAIVRFTVLKAGGAVTVREKLLPVAFALFLAAVLAHLVFWGIDLAVYLADPGGILHEDLDPQFPNLF